MSKKKPNPKFKHGDVVLVLNEELTVTGSPSWNGMVYMYAFENSDMRCGEEYLKPVQPKKPCQ